MSDHRSRSQKDVDLIADLRRRRHRDSQSGGASDTSIGDTTQRIDSYLLHTSDVGNTGNGTGDSENANIDGHLAVGDLGGVVNLPLSDAQNELSCRIRLLDMRVRSQCNCTEL